MVNVIFKKLKRTNKFKKSLNKLSALSFFIELFNEFTT